jgi:serralysin
MSDSDISWPTRPEGLPVYVDALLYDPDGSLGEITWHRLAYDATGMVPIGVHGRAESLTYSFRTSAAPDATSDLQSTFQPFSAVQRAGARSALSLWSEVCGLTFTEVASDGDIAFSTAIGPAPGWSDSPQESHLGVYSWHPVEEWDFTTVEVYLHNAVSTNDDMTPGGAGLRLLIHETGHAIGFKHPGAYADDAFAPGPYLADFQDTRQYTVMSYIPSSTSLVFPSTPMVDDIAAAQYLYGANMTTRTGNDVYSFAAGAETLQAIWDAGGNDTLDASNQTVAAIVDLHPGAYSSIGIRNDGAAASANIGIAWGATIENATGTDFDDILVGNQAANLLQGGAGTDVLMGYGGSDVMDGGAGNDTAVFRGRRAQYAVATTDGMVTVQDLVSGRDGADTLTNIEFVQFADALVRVSALATVA